MIDFFVSHNLLYALEYLSYKNTKLSTKFHVNITFFGQKFDFLTKMAFKTIFRPQKHPK